MSLQDSSPNNYLAIHSDNSKNVGKKLKIHDNMGQRITNAPLLVTRLWYYFDKLLCFNAPVMIASSDDNSHCFNYQVAICKV